MSEFIRYVGFCGADDSIHPELLCVLSKHYPWIEWGVLLRSDLQGTARYASPEWVQRLANHVKTLDYPVRLAAHLCFDRCNQVLNGDSTFLEQLQQYGFKRVQINATAANGVNLSPDLNPTYAENIRSIAQKLPELEFIFQFNVETQVIWKFLSESLPANISILYDASCGKGVEINSFPSPLDYKDNSCGYAGGIGPHNVESVLKSVMEVGKQAGKSVWIDMESSLRQIVLVKNPQGIEERKDIFSIHACSSCMLVAASLGLPTF